MAPSSFGRCCVRDEDLHCKIELPPPVVATSGKQTTNDQQTRRGTGPVCRPSPRLNHSSIIFIRYVVYWCPYKRRRVVEHQPEHECAEAFAFPVRRRGWVGPGLSSSSSSSFVRSRIRSFPRSLVRSFAHQAGCARDHPRRRRGRSGRSGGRVGREARGQRRRRAGASRPRGQDDEAAEEKSREESEGVV